MIDMKVVDAESQRLSASTDPSMPPPAYPPSRQQSMVSQPPPPAYPSSREQSATSQSPSAYYTPSGQQSVTSPSPPSAYRTANGLQSVTSQRPEPAYPANGQQSVTSPPTLTPEQQEAMIGVQYQQQMLAHCARGQHEITTNYGIGGIIAAIFCFPCGLLCLFADREESCTRCGKRLN